MIKADHGIGRRGFIKSTAIAGMAAALPAGSLFQQEGQMPSRPLPAGAKRNLVLLSDSPDSYARLQESIRSIREYEFTVFPVKVNYREPQDLINLVRGKSADLVLMCTPRVNNSSGPIPAALGNLDIPIVLFPPNPDLIMLEADMVATFRMKGIAAMLANSEPQAVEMVKIAAAPRILEGRKAVIFGRPFDSTSVPARHLSEEYVYRATGVRLQYRPIDELKPLLDKVSEEAARKEMERWKKEAAKIVEPANKAILDSSRLYVLLRSLAEKEGLSAISIDCLSFSFNQNSPLPLPCLAFTRLRDEGIAAPCEADVCASMSSMFLQAISQKPSYFCNVSSVNRQKSTAVLRHCVAPLRLLGRDAAPLTYNLRDYHGMGRGVTPEVTFPTGIDVTMGVFGKDLKSYTVWPGRTQVGINDTARPSFENAPPAMQKMRMFCSNRAEVKLKSIDRFMQNIGACHHVMVAGSYGKAISDALLRMNVEMVGPADLSAPQN